MKTVFVVGTFAAELVSQMSRAFYIGTIVVEAEGD